MKLNKNIFKLNFILVASMVFIMAGCAKKPTPAETAIASFDLYQKDTITENFPGKETDSKKLIEDNKKLSIDYMKHDYGEYKGDIDIQKIESIHSKLVEISRKINPKAEEISVEGDKAVVKLSAKLIDESKYEKMFQEKWDKLTEEEAQDVNKVLDIQEEYYDEIIRNPIFTDKEESIQINMIKDQGYWIIDSQKELKKLNDLVFKEE